MSDVDDESDDEDWQYIEKVIGDRKSDDEQSTDTSQRSQTSSLEVVLNIDDFFGVEKASTSPPTDYSFHLQRAIEDSLTASKSQVSETQLSEASSSSAHAEGDTDDDLQTPTKFSSPSLSSSCPRSRTDRTAQAVMKYHSSADDSNLINLFSDEVLKRILSLADYTIQRVCRRWSILQIKVSRLKIVETLTTVSQLNHIIAGQIEFELFQLYSEKLSKEFRQRARSLIFNLRGNEELRNRVSDGSLQPSQLVRMESSETATRDLAQQRCAWMAESIVASRERRVVETLRPISTFGCPVCSHNRCEIFHRRKGIIVDGITTSLKCMKCGSFTDQ